MKRRLDTILIERGVAASGREAFIVVTEGRVYVNGQKAISPGQLVGDADTVEIRPGREYVGRGAYKLSAALDSFGVDPAGKICADIGAATGGFTEVLLKRGAEKVYAIDAGRGKLDVKLRQDPRVIAMEETNVLTMPSSPEPIDLITVDVSFIPLRSVLSRVRPWFRSELENLSDRSKSTTTASVIALFKPQYEVEDKSLLRHGILRDDAARAALVERFRRWLGEQGWRELGFMESPIRGSEGNVEYLFHLVPA